MKISRGGASFIIFLLILMTMGLTGYSPIAIHIVMGYSMYPNFRPGDLLVSANTLILDYEPGDVAVYCIQLGGCIAHRVESIHGGMVVFKGDNNPSSDPPVPAESVKYRVLARIPLPLWMPITLTVAVAWLQGSRIKSPEVAAIALFITVITVAAYTSAAPPGGVNMPLPDASLKYAKIVNETMIEAMFRVNNTRLESIDSCVASTIGALAECTWTNYTIQGDWILFRAGIPVEVLAAAYTGQSREIVVHVNFTMSNGVLLASRLPAYITWREPEAVLDEGVLTIVNNLPFHLRVGINLTLYTSTWPVIEPPKNVYFEVVVKPFQSYSASVGEEYRYARAWILYTVEEAGVSGELVLKDAG
ncbi:MAG: signal peptidase I [Desulfurococcales archaeon]|nr:signal peptidase I [Desulfurococcales archaeon]